MDILEKAQQVASDLSFPIAHGVTREIADTLGSWWDDRRNFIQPSEFIIDQQGRVLSSTYSSSPIGRTDPAEALVLLQFMEARKKAK